jgi:hypothetical protein
MLNGFSADESTAIMWPQTYVLDNVLSVDKKSQPALEKQA